MGVELNEESTSEDISKAVDEIISSRHGESQENEVGDGSKIAADESVAPVELPVAEEKPGDEKTAPEGEGTGNEWLTDDLKAEAAVFGVSEEKLAKFTSEDELERALQLFGDTALDAGRKALATGETEKSKAPDKKEEPSRETKEGQYEVKLADWMDEEVKVELEREFTQLRDHYEDRLEAIETRFREADIQAEERHMDNLIDALGCADLFGTSGKESKKELERREDLIVAAKAQQKGLELFGRNVDLDQTLVFRMAKALHGDYFDKKALKAKTRKLVKQAESRGGDSATKSPAPKETLMEEMESLYKSLEGAA